MSLCLSANASPEREAVAPPREGMLGRFRRFLSPVEAEGELMPAPTRADVLRARPGAASRDEINALLL